jgi:protein TonB
MDKRFIGAGLGVGLALLAHGTAAARVGMIDVELLAWTRQVRLVINDKLAATYDIDVEKPKPPEPAPEPPKEEPPVEKAPPPPPAAKAAAPPPPPAAAQAGAVLTQAPDDTPVDFTNSFVTGNSEQYAGGVTQATGTSAVAVRDRNAQAGGVPGGTGTKPAPPAPVAQDLSRQASVNDRNWGNCDFPPEADTEQINDMKVPMELTISADGKVLKADVLRDPGYGFKRAAMQCVMRQASRSFTVALDREGHSIGSTFKVNINFSR